MDYDLRCNNLKCRRMLSFDGQAVVTTCSHAFCLKCANALFRDPPRCPACRTDLPEPDDLVCTTLQPSNDYRTSVLSGLSPTHIMDIATRALGFWNYQVSQELAYQNLQLKESEERLAAVQNELAATVRGAKAEVALTHRKLTNLDSEFELERKKNHVLGEKLSEQSRQYTKLQDLYDRAKKKALYRKAGMIKDGSSPPDGYTSLPERQSVSSRSFVGNGQPRGSFVTSMPPRLTQRMNARGGKDTICSVDQNSISGMQTRSRQGSAFVDDMATPYLGGRPKAFRPARRL